MATTETEIETANLFGKVIAVCVCVFMAIAGGYIYAAYLLAAFGLLSFAASQKVGSIVFAAMSLLAVCGFFAIDGHLRGVPGY